MEANNSVCARTNRLNKLIVTGNDDAAAVALNRETLLDAFSVLYNECARDALKKNDSNVFDFVKKCKWWLLALPRECVDLDVTWEMRYLPFCCFNFGTDRDAIAETKKLRVNLNDFTVKSLIGKGYFGEVHLAVENVTKDVYAIKKMPKASFVHAKEERNILAVSDTEWIPALQYAFQVSFGVAQAIKLT